MPSKENRPINPTNKEKFQKEHRKWGKKGRAKMKELGLLPHKDNKPPIVRKTYTMNLNKKLIDEYRKWCYSTGAVLSKRIEILLRKDLDERKK